MPTDIPQWPKVDRRLFESEILPAGRPVIFKGAVDHWPLVQRRTDSAAAITEPLCRAPRIHPTGCTDQQNPSGFEDLRAPLAQNGTHVP